jgi:hypothetical protein
MVDLTLDSADGLAAWRDSHELAAGTSDWEARVYGHAKRASGTPGEVPPYPVLWAGARPSLYVSADQFLRHAAIEADPELVRNWLLQQFQEQALRKNRGVFFIPEADVEQATQVSGAQHLQVHGSTRMKGRRFNLLSGLTPAEAAKVLLAVLPPVDTCGGSEYSRESGLFSLLLIFKAQQAAGDAFSLVEISQLLSRPDALQALSARAGKAGYYGLSQYLASASTSTGPRLAAQNGLASRLFSLSSQLHAQQWFHPKGEALVPYLAASLTSVCLGPDKLGDGLAELQRVWLEFIGVLMARRQAQSLLKQLFVCGWPLVTKHTQSVMSGLLPVTQGTGNVFLFGVEPSQPPQANQGVSPLQSLAATRLKKLAGADWEITQTL